VFLIFHWPSFSYIYFYGLNRLTERHGVDPFSKKKVSPPFHL
jgi:hypothetical protein